MKVGPYLPIDLFPGDTIGFSDVSYEFFEIPCFVNNVLCSHLTIGVNKRCTFPAAQHLPLFLGEQFVAIGTLVEMVFVLLKKKFKFFHKEPGDNLIFTLFQIIQSVKTHFFGHFTDDVSIYAGHVYLNSGNFLNMLTDEIQAFTDKSINF